MLKSKRVINQQMSVIALSILFLLIVSCRQTDAVVETTLLVEEVEISSNAPPDVESNGVTAGDESGGPVRVENSDGPPFYARFGENETFSDGERVVIVFYRQPDCIPADFNLNQFFHFPGEDSPGAYACAPPTVKVFETWETALGEGPAPLVAESMGTGAVPVWFFSAEEIEMALADGVVTIGDLADLPSRQVGTASTYNELLHPSQSNEDPLIQFTAEGTLEDGRDFIVDVSLGASDRYDHVTIGMVE